MARAVAAPDSAAEHAAKALNFFRQCNDEGWADKAEEWRKKCMIKRTCWMCHREMQGQDLHFEWFPATVGTYAQQITSKLGQDTSSIANGQLVLCKPCGSAVEQVADRFATHRTQQLREEVRTTLKNLQSTIQSQQEALLALNSRLQEVERASHRR